MKEIAKSYRIIITNLIPQKVTEEENILDLEELWALIETLGNGKVVTVIQQKGRPFGKTYFGKGKVEEIIEKITELSADLMIVNDFLKPSQVHMLQKKIQKTTPNIQVWDKIDLILEIFSKHAKTKEANLQIKLAQMRHMGPRIYGMGSILSRQGGGIGTVGIGETNTELMKRHWKQEIRKVYSELEVLKEIHEKQLERRKDLGLSTVSIVGYTNSGKTSLFNRLTGKQNLSANALFATLDSSVGKKYLHVLKKEIMISDTIGFIKNLPPKLIDAFKSTLLESVHADLLLHVIDASDPSFAVKIKVVEDILKELKIENKKQLFVFNKIDKLPEDCDLENMFGPYTHTGVFVSAKNNTGMDTLEKLIGESLFS